MKRRGMTLAECLLTMFLFMLALGVAAGLASNYANVLRFGAGKQRTLQVAVVGLDRLRAELNEAFRVDSPNSGVPVPLVEFARTDPAAARLPAPPPGDPPGWTPLDPASTVSVRYFVQNQALVREVRGSRTVVASGVNGLSARLLSNQNVEIALSVRESTRVQSLKIEVFLLSVR